MVHIPKDHAAADVILLQHRHGPSNHYIAQCRLDDSEDESEDQDFWPDWANVTGENDSLNFNQQIVELPQHDCFVGLTPTSLWAMDLPTIRADMSASDIASKLKWRKVLDLPIEKKQEQEQLKICQFPCRLLARHGPDQVIIFGVE
ncbi:unnamed protein product, partial [Symbiodinium pilosum]